MTADNPVATHRHTPTARRTGSRFTAPVNAPMAGSGSGGTTPDRNGSEHPTGRAGGQVQPPGGGDFEAVYRAEAPRVVRHVMTHGATVEQAWDATQAAFEQAYRSWHRIDYPKAWLRIAAMGHYRRAAVPETPTDYAPDRPGLATAALAAELDAEARTVLAELGALPPKQRQVMAWTFDGYSPADIAAVLGEDPAAVRQNLRRARDQLKRRLGHTPREVTP